mgnify:CR=1 FL=1
MISGGNLNAPELAPRGGWCWMAGADGGAGMVLTEVFFGVY